MILLFALVALASCADAERHWFAACWHAPPSSAIDVDLLSLSSMSFANDSNDVELPAVERLVALPHCFRVLKRLTFEEFSATFLASSPLRRRRVHWFERQTTRRWSLRSDVRLAQADLWREPNDTLSGLQWHLSGRVPTTEQLLSPSTTLVTSANVYAAWQLGSFGANKTIALVDDGVNWRHNGSRFRLLRSHS